MKKTVSLLSALLVMLCAFQTFAFADIVDPFPSPTNNDSMLPILFIAVAIVVIAVVLWRVRRQKK